MQEIQQKRKLEQGSIMLEVIAVLALMGVMGAMMFRQIYLRNQELHNVQMASEMRTIKEAFSAYIQAQPVDLEDKCPGPTIAEYSANNDILKTCVDSALYNRVQDYLPDGWFTGNTLKENYVLIDFSYRDKDTANKIRHYGMIVPRTSSLPATGWNYKRAARVALLIGADGGVWGSLDADNINGSMGTWSLAVDLGLKSDLGSDANDAFPSSSAVKDSRPVAITGLDIFTPEYEKVEGTVNLPETWSLQLRDLNAYQFFSVASDDSTSRCFQSTYIDHNGTEPGGTTVKSDTVETTISSSCIPNFWVDASDTNGQVYTRNDLNIGVDTTNPTNSDNAHPPAVRISKEGVIFFAPKDLSGNVITATDPQDSSKAKAYVLDPAYTSIMNDVKLMSRGGARLSEILPNYILKNMGEKGLTANTGDQITMPNCPTGYKKALLVIPTLAVKTKKISVTNTAPTTNLSETASSGTGVSVVAGVTSSDTVDVKGTDDTTKTVLKSTALLDTTIYASTAAPTATVNLSDDTGDPQVAVDVPTIQVWSSDSNCNSSSGSNYLKDTSAKIFCVQSDKALNITYQAFCVFEGTTGSTNRTNTSTNKAIPKTQAECQAFGGTWTSGTCSWS